MTPLGPSWLDEHTTMGIKNKSQCPSFSCSLWQTWHGQHFESGPWARFLQWTFSSWEIYATANKNAGRPFLSKRETTVLQKNPKLTLRLQAIHHTANWPDALLRGSSQARASGKWSAASAGIHDIPEDKWNKGNGTRVPT